MAFQEARIETSMQGSQVTSVMSAPRLSYYQLAAFGFEFNALEGMRKEVMAAGIEVKKIL